MEFKKNHLAAEKSLYLKQHATNPVEWYPWGEEALQKAKDTHKPILLSIGYSACHWCHVMAHESFEDPETATLMNEHFINIKVDREERPDLDKIYQTALQILTGKPGGWPLTMFLTSDHQLPFFGGTYFPKHSAHGLPSFREVLKKLTDFYHKNPQNIEEISEKIQLSLKQLEQPPHSEELELSLQPWTQARNQLAQEFDVLHGGFGKAPKFPHPHYLSFLLRDGYVHINFKNESLAMASRSLTKMAHGGIYDQLGSGFYRYSVDGGWLIPHFEKMLYDNAQLLVLYIHLHLLTNEPLFKEITLDLGHWVLRELQCPEGGYFSALAADTEGHEGKFYCWNRDEVRQQLTAEEYSIAEQYWGFNLPANFEKQWHLFVANSSTLESNKSTLTHIRQKLFHVRSSRPRPEADSKIVPAWNALMVKSMLTAGIILDQEAFIHSAERALNYLLQNTYENLDDMKFLDDYAFLLDALLLFLQYQWSDTYLQWAIKIADYLLENFYDDQRGGFYFTSKHAETLIQRPKYFMDEATPSGNSIVTLNLIRLSYLLNESKYLVAAEKTLQESWGAIQSFPAGYSNMLQALLEYFTPPVFIILRGEDKELQEWKKLFYQFYLPDHLCFTLESNLKSLPAVLDKPINKKSTQAYICQGKTCQKTLVSKEEFLDYLKMKSQ